MTMGRGQKYAKGPLHYTLAHLNGPLRHTCQWHYCAQEPIIPNV